MRRHGQPGLQPGRRSSVRGDDHRSRGHRSPVAVDHALVGQRRHRRLKCDRPRWQGGRQQFGYGPHARRGQAERAARHAPPHQVEEPAGGRQVLLEEHAGQERPEEPFHESLAEACRRQRLPRGRVTWPPYQSRGGQRVEAGQSGQRGQVTWPGQPIGHATQGLPRGTRGVGEPQSPPTVVHQHPGCEGPQPQLPERKTGAHLRIGGVEDLEPRSTTQPSTRSVRIRPPTRSPASSTCTRSPSAHRSRAQAKPARPPPTTTASHR